MRGRVVLAGGLERDGQMQGEDVEKLHGLLVELRAADPAQAEHAARLLAGLQRRVGVAVAGRGVGREEDASRAHRLFALVGQLDGVRPAGDRAAGVRDHRQGVLRAVVRQQDGAVGLEIAARQFERARRQNVPVGRCGKRCAVSIRARDCDRKDLLRAAPSAERARAVSVLRSCGSKGLRRKSTAPRRIPSSAYSSVFDAAMMMTCVSGNISLIFASNWMPSIFGIASVMTRSAARARSCCRAPATDPAVSTEYPSPRSSAAECAAQARRPSRRECATANSPGPRAASEVELSRDHLSMGCLLLAFSAYSRGDLGATPCARFVGLRRFRIGFAAFPKR